MPEQSVGETAGETAGGDLAAVAEAADEAMQPAATAVEAQFRRALALMRTDAEGAGVEALRGTPWCASSRGEVIHYHYRCASLDPEFRDFVRRADAARDLANFNEAEYFYYRALQLYPLHGGYMVQYAHMLKD
ncbi:MAG TPA: hypothetical protein VHE37_03535, partial [Nevskiaceae bacterium]|nr:hypothetical protein [Nevskiaceae bacterium]